MCVTSAFVLNKDDESNLALMNALLSAHIESPESSVRHVLNTQHYRLYELHQFSETRVLIIYTYGKDHTR